MIAPHTQRRILRFAKAASSLVACALVLLSTSAAEACPMCKTALGTNAQHFVNAWGASIVFMLSMPFLLVGSFSVYMYILVRRARAEQTAKQPTSMHAAEREPAREVSLVE
jgi:hypothetical protein